MHIKNLSNGFRDKMVKRSEISKNRRKKNFWPSITDVVAESIQDLEPIHNLIYRAMEESKRKRTRRLKNTEEQPYRLKSWTISEEFWSKVEPFIPDPTRDPKKEYRRAPGAGRKPIAKRRVFEAIVYVARTGIQWRALPKAVFGVGTAIHKYFMEWSRAGVFDRIWQAGLAEYDEMEGVAWLWQSVGGSMNKAPLAKESAGPNPTDRGKRGDQAFGSCRRSWRPAVVCRIRSKHA
jgi:transposase